MRDSDLFTTFPRYLAIAGDGLPYNVIGAFGFCSLLTGFSPVSDE
jgi:hypothetical protein